MSVTQHKIWCDDDEHYQYEHFTDFNEWLDSEEAEFLRNELGIDDLSQPSKALFASDREAYDQAFGEFRNQRRHDALNEQHFTEHFGGNHWFERNLAHFIQLVDLMEENEVVPFVGAGISVSAGFPSWENHLREQGRTANIDSNHIEELLEIGAYETVLEEIEEIRGSEVFIQEIQDVFSRKGAIIPDVVWRISELFYDTLITTNYDNLLEKAYDTGEEDTLQVINGMSILEKPDPNKTTIMKLHGDIREPARCILSKNQYDEAYGEELDVSRPIPKSLSYYYKNSSLLFLGCSLKEDRTVDVFKAIKSKMGEEAQIPQHFSIEAAPEDPEELATRNAYLAQLRITPIWFKQGQYDYVENILRLAKSELSYRGVVPQRALVQALEEPCVRSVNLELNLDDFLRDFVQLMPLMHWLHKTIPQSATNKYLNALQRIFIGHSLFTEQLDKNLADGLDHILRAFTLNDPKFNGYTYEKLSKAFKYFQSYLQSKGMRNHVGDTFEWNYLDILTIPQSQFEEVLALENNDFDHYAIRLIIVLLKHGRHQLSSPKQYCELPDNINQEFGDYLSLALSTRLGLAIPDRMEDFSNNDIRDLCKDAWDNFDRPPKYSFLEKVRSVLPF